MRTGSAYPCLLPTFYYPQVRRESDNVEGIVPHKRVSEAPLPPEQGVGRAAPALSSEDEDEEEDDKEDGDRDAAGAVTAGSGGDDNDDGDDSQGADDEDDDSQVDLDMSDTNLFDDE